MYNFALLDPRATPEAKAHNDEILGDGSDILGIEVTIPALASRCGLGNIDPQHLGGNAKMAAIEAAWTHPLPPEDTTLVTIRPDADALGAMTILCLRASSPETLYDESVTRRVAMIAVADEEASGPWPGPHKVTPEQMAGPIAVLSAMCMEHERSLDERLRLMKDWVLTGRFFADDSRLSTLRLEAQAALDELHVTTISGVAVVVGSHRWASRFGYAHAPVFVATNPSCVFAGGEPHRKHTIARWNTQYPMDWDGLRTDLQNREPGWGGSSSIMGSPQGEHSILTTEEVVEQVLAHLKD